MDQGLNTKNIMKILKKKEKKTSLETKREPI